MANAESGVRDEAGASLAEEDRARADLYALFARLFYAGPDADLLAAIAAQAAGGAEASPFDAAWGELVLAARTADATAATVEYDEVFIGTGKAEVTPYACHYLAETGREKILVGLRDELQNLGLARHAAAREPEDHFAALFEVMRHLISAAGGGDIALQKQRQFFERYLERSHAPFFDAVEQTGKAVFYRHVSRCAKAFMHIESEALKMSND